MDKKAESIRTIPRHSFASMDSHSPAPAQQLEQQEPSPNWAELLQDVAVSIFLRVGAIEILSSLQFVCSTWHRICKDPSMWSTINMINLDDPWDTEYDLVKMCKRAIDRSCGGLIDITIENFGDDGLLEYIADRSSHLKQLRLIYGDEISDEGLSLAARKLVLLEELEISYCNLSKTSLHVVGQFCPLLKSFKLNVSGFKYPRIECNAEALVIAENMPRLCHLQIFGNKLTNDGLQAILDGCPLLESLDLRRCFNVCLEGDLKRICTERIKDLRCPYDPTDDYPYDIGLSDDDFSNIHFMSDDDEHYEFHGGGTFIEDYYDSSDLEDFYFY